MIQELQTAGISWMRLGAGDASVQQLLDRFGKQSADVSNEQMLELLNAASDYGQISYQEWAQIYNWARKNQGHLSPEALQTFEKVDQFIQSRGGGVPHTLDAFSLPGAGRAGKPILEGAALKDLLADLAPKAAPESPKTQAPPAFERMSTLDRKPAAAGETKDAETTRTKSDAPDKADKSEKTSKTTKTDKSDKSDKSATTKTSTRSSRADVAERAGEISRDIEDLTNQIQNLNPEDKDYAGQLFVLQQKLYRLQEHLKLFTQMLKAVHEMNMDVIQNIRV